MTAFVEAWMFLNCQAFSKVTSHFFRYSGGFMIMTSVLPVNTFKNIFNLHDYDVGPQFLGANSFRGLRNLHGDCLPILHKYGE